MKWPFVTRKVHELELAKLRDQLGYQQAVSVANANQATYWRTRAERLTDSALARAGAIHEPTMVEKKPEPKNPLATVAAALSMKEFDSAEVPSLVE